MIKPSCIKCNCPVIGDGTCMGKCSIDSKIGASAVVNGKCDAGIQDDLPARIDNHLIHGDICCDCNNVPALNRYCTIGTRRSGSSNPARSVESLPCCYAVPVSCRGASVVTGSLSKSCPEICDHKHDEYVSRTQRDLHGAFSK